MSSKAEDVVESPPNEAATASDAVITPIFTPWQKRWIVFLAASAAMFSPMSSFIFYPAIKMIADSLDVTIGLVNLAITTYMIVSGIVPALLGNAADKFGRRPIYILALSLYFVANLGLALQNTYAGLLVLRMLQSAGSSGTISLGYGIISDITSRAERGSYVGVMLLGPNVAPPVGPVLGGAVGANLGWKWIFWLLCILGGACLVLILLALPETCHVIIGDGNLPLKGIYRTPITSVRHHRKDNRAIEEVTAALRAERVSKSIWPNPVACLKLLLLKDVAVVLICNGIYYTIYCSIQASLSTLFIEIYKYQPLEAGLIYIPFGIACLFGTFIWGERYIKPKHGQVFRANLKPGKVLDYDYSRVAKSFGVSAEEVRGREAIGAFPVEKARLGSALYLVAISTVGVIGYGWAIHYHVHVAVPLILQAFVGFSGTGLFVALGTLLTDLNSTRPSTAAASANLVRCALAATALAVLQPIIDRVGVGWCFTIFGVLGGICAPLMIWAIRCGGSCRQKREMPGEPTEE